jgi:hypothetical protein
MAEDRFEQLARTAGEELRRPAPEGGLARVSAARRRRELVAIAAVSATAVAVTGGLLLWVARDRDEGVAIDSTPSSSDVTTTRPVQAPTTTDAVIEPSTTQVDTKSVAPTASSTTTRSTATVVPMSSPGGAVSYVAPPPTLALRPLGEVELAGDEFDYWDVAVGDLGVAVYEAESVTVIGFDGTRRVVPVDGRLGSIVYGPGDVLYGVRDGATIQEFAMVAVALSGDRAGATIASASLPWAQYMELPVASFGHSGDGIVDRERDINSTVMGYVDIAGQQVAWPDATPALVTTSPDDLNTALVSVSTSSGTTWRLDIDASPSRASPFIDGPPAAPSSNGLVVYSTHIGPNARPDTDFGEPTMFVLAAMYPDGSVQWHSIPDGWQIVASDVWGTVLARRTDDRLELALTDLPPPAVDGAPSTTDLDSLIGREWSGSTYLSVLDFPAHMRMGTQGSVARRWTSRHLRRDVADRTRHGRPSRARVLRPDVRDRRAADATDHHRGARSLPCRRRAALVVTQRLLGRRDVRRSDPGDHRASPCGQRAGSFRARLAGATCMAVRNERTT